MVVLGYLPLAVAALPLLTASSPIKPRGHGTFTIKQQLNAHFSGNNGILAISRAYGKYGAPMTGADQGYDGSLVPGEAPAIPAQFDREYVVPVSFGGQTLRMDLDTGSSDLWRILKLYEIATHNDILPSWVFSTLLSAASQIGHYVYDKTKSSTFKDLPGLTFQIIYGDGSSASGVVGTETVNVGGIAVKDQSIELATVVSGGFVQDTNSDGLLGMGFNTINQVKPVKQKTFLDNALPQLALPVFTADLKHSLPGTYDFGFIDPKKHKGNITFVPIVGSVGFWSFNVTGHGVGNSFNAQPSLGVADTGTTLLLLESAVVASYYAAVPGSAFDANQGGFTFPCKTQLPSFTVGIGSHKAVISGSLMNFVPIASTGKCFGSLQSRGSIGFSIYGDILFKSQFVVFDAGQKRLGFADKP